MHSGVAAPATDLWTRHSWRQLPWFSDADAKNVMDFGAKGNGVADDTNAIQRAIDTHNKVFLPRGDYRLTRQLVLRKNTQLFGVSGQRSRLYADWNPGAKLTHAIKTDTAADATTYLADIVIMLPGGYERSYMGAIDWRAGKNSWARQVAADWPWEADNSSAPRSILHVGPSGGGRWYGFTSIPRWRASNPAFRYVLVENTAQPIVFYGMNIEHGDGLFLFEMVNSSNLAIMGTKTETAKFGRFANSRNILVAGLSGHSNYGPGPGGALVFEGADDVLAANITYYAAQIAQAKGPMVSEKWGGTTYSTPGTKYTSLFRRGTFCRLCF
jgi:hypothetical protein